MDVRLSVPELSVAVGGVQDNVAPVPGVEHVSGSTDWSVGQPLMIGLSLSEYEEKTKFNKKEGSLNLSRMKKDYVNKLTDWVIYEIVNPLPRFDQKLLFMVIMTSM